MADQDMQQRIENASRNKAPAAIQITAEQILREAKERIVPTKAPTKQMITDKEELLEYQQIKRKGFEDAGFCLKV